MEKDEITLYDGELTGRKKTNRDYMMSLSADNLLRNYKTLEIQKEKFYEKKNLTPNSFFQGIFLFVTPS